MSSAALYVRVIRQLGREKRLAATLALANLVLAIAQFAEPVLFGRIVDKLANAQGARVPPAFGELALPMGAWAGFGLFNILAGALVALNADRLSHRRRMAIIADYFEHVLHLPLSFHNEVHSGRLLKVMLEGASGMAGLWLAFFREHCASFVSLFILLPMTLFINWRLGSLLLLLVFVFGALTSLVLRRTEGMQTKVERFHSEMAARASDALGNISVIQSFTRVEAETRAMRGLIDSLLAAQIPVLSWWAVAAIATRASATLTILGIFALGTWLHMRGEASIGEIVTFTSFATLLIGKLEQVVGFVNMLVLQAPKLREFFAIFDTVPAVRDRASAQDAGRLQGNVAFENVSFAYDGLRGAVSNVSFSVSPGETIALVGATGAGKSTTMNLLHRVFDPQIGRVTVDGRDIRDLTLASLRRNIGVVFQEPMLFARSIEENLRAGKPDATPEELALALSRAQATSFVARQPNGLATLVGERGRTLSGGERQRLAIARALVKDPPILIFDEATSALDAATERQLQIALEAATQGRTTFIIAHRLATIRKATRILVFDQGSVIQCGSFAELSACDGPFAVLAQAQLILSEGQVAASGAGI